MSTDVWMAEDLVCPFDQGTLSGVSDWLSCRQCGRGYPVLDGIPTFLPVDESAAWREVINCRGGSLMAAGTEAADRERSVELRRNARRVEQSLARHVNLQPHHRVLQLGVSTESEVHHLRVGTCYAVAPLAGLLGSQGLLKWGRVRWVSGRGEELPFADEAFQLVLLTDILNYSESPEAVLAEVSRCLADDGVVWVSQTVYRTPWWHVWRRWLGKDHIETARDGSLWKLSAHRVMRAARQASLFSCWSTQSSVLPNGKLARWLCRGGVSRQEIVLKASGKPQLAKVRSTRLASPIVQRPAATQT